MTISDGTAFLKAVPFSLDDSPWVSHAEEPSKTFMVLKLILSSSLKFRIAYAALGNT